MLDDSVGDYFAAGPRYLNTASVGLAPRRVADAVRESIASWEEGRCDPVSFDPDVERAREAFGRLAGTDSSSVAIIAQVSVISGLVASCMPDGARVLCAEEEFSSLLYPFLADERLDVRLVPLDQLLEQITTETDLVAASAVQSADGRVLDLDELARVASETQTRTYVDITQAAGWLPLGADRFDVTACGAYKWLCSPRGSGFMTVRPGTDWLIARFAGWYGGDDPWDSLYGAPLKQAPDARRFNVSPAWFSFVGAAHAVELLADIGVDAIHEHSVELANHFRGLMDLPASNSAIVSVSTVHGDVLEAAGVSAAVRAGRVRLSFYLYNTLEDAELAASLLQKGQIT